MEIICIHGTVHLYSVKRQVYASCPAGTPIFHRAIVETFTSVSSETGCLQREVHAVFHRTQRVVPDSGSESLGQLL